MQTKFTFHLIPNAHIDPVWLWDWREGLNEGLVTCRTILDLMDENRALTFIRGETFIYEHIEKTDPATFARIKKYVRQKRWDPVGGTVIQPDTNLPDTETFARHLLHGQRYLASRFGKPSRVAWAADSFGHAAGLPEIFAGAGIEYFAFTRPAATIVPLAKPAFWWAAASGKRVLAYRAPAGWYGCEREEMPKRLDEFLKLAPQYGLANLAILFGLGNHGGGPTRRQIADVRAWAKEHPDVSLAFSTFHHYFDTLKSEISKRPRDFLPTHQGELNFVLRGCYSSVAKFKFAYRRTEARLQRAERTDTIIRGLGVLPLRYHRNSSAALRDAWHSVLFNSFHDILPGSSIERAFDDQLSWVGGAYHAAQVVEFDALNQLASQIDTSVPKPTGDNPSAVSLLVFNPHPFPYAGPFELESTLDYRPIWKYSTKDNPPANLPVRVTGPNGRDIPFQPVETEHHAMIQLAWRKRIVIHAEFPAFGWSVVRMAYDEVKGSTGHAPKANESVAAASSKNGIKNEAFAITAGKSSVQIHHDGKPLLSAPGLQVITVEDPWGSWGGMAEEADSIDLSTVRDTWRITQTKVLEPGPLRAALWVRFEAGRSRLDLTFRVSPSDSAVRVAARLFLNERSARVKLVIPFGDRAEFDVPGGSVTRGPAGEVPGLRWVKIFRDNKPAGTPKTLGFASDVLYNFDAKDGVFRVTIARASRYADDVVTSPDSEPWRPAIDAGELKFNFLLTLDDKHLPMLARQLAQPPVTLRVPSHQGNLPRSGSLAALSPDTIEILALKRAEDSRSLILRIRETAGRAVSPNLKLNNKSIKLPRITAFGIVTIRLTPRGAGWTVTLTDTTETL